MLKTKAYYEVLNTDVRKNLRTIEYHIQMASGWKSLYEATKNKRGYKWLNRLARRQNGIHYSKGMALSIESLSTCMTTIDELTEFLENEGS